MLLVPYSKLRFANVKSAKTLAADSGGKRIYIFLSIAYICLPVNLFILLGVLQFSYFFCIINNDYRKDYFTIKEKKLGKTF